MKVVPGDGRGVIGERLTVEVEVSLYVHRTGGDRGRVPDLVRDHVQTSVGAGCRGGPGDIGEVGGTFLCRCTRRGDVRLLRDRGLVQAELSGDPEVQSL